MLLGNSGTGKSHLLIAEEMFRSSSLAPDTCDVIRQLGDLEPSTLAVMHGSSFRGNGAKAFYDLAAAYEDRYFRPAA